MLLSTQFPELFREELYAVNLMLNDDRQFDNALDSVLAHKPIDGIWTKEYSMVPIGVLGGRTEAAPIPQKNMTMGYVAYGAQSIEASGKVNLSKEMEQRSREFRSADGIDESRFAGYVADTIARGFLSRQKTKWQQLCADIFNFGGIQAGNAFFNQRIRAGGLADIPNTQLIYDGVALFAAPGAPHPSYSNGAVVGPGSAPVGTCANFAGTVPDTGGYFNAFQFPPSYWALKRVVTHYKFNMGFDENNVRFMQTPDVLVVSSYNTPRWLEILKSRFIEPMGVVAGGVQTGNIVTNRENIFVSVEGFKLELIESPYLLPNTWYVGRKNSGGILILDPSKEEDPWAYYRDEDNRAYFISFEDNWGFLIRNWRNWVAGAYSVDGVTAPNFGSDQTWDTIPVGV